MPVAPVIDVIIPAYNEEKAVGKVISEIPAGLTRRVIVCNNNSTDQTSAEASRSGAIVVDAPLRGYGSACLAGINYIYKDHSVIPPDIVVFMDADYSDYPMEMHNLIVRIIEGNDLVIGSRVLGQASKGSFTGVQRFGNWLATRLIDYFYGFRFTDLGPFRAIRWNKLILLDMRDQTYGWTVEMQVKALKHKLRCAEVPVSYRKRIGQSKISGTLKGSILAGHKIIWTIIKSL